VCQPITEIKVRLMINFLAQGLIYYYLVLARAGRTNLTNSTNYILLPGHASLTATTWNSAPDVRFFSTNNLIPSANCAIVCCDLNIVHINKVRKGRTTRYESESKYTEQNVFHRFLNQLYIFFMPAFSLAHSITILPAR